MNISALSVSFDAESMWVELTDGRTLGIPLARFPRLLHATPAQRKRVELNRAGLHWDGEQQPNLSPRGFSRKVCGS